MLCIENLPFIVVGIMFFMKNYFLGKYVDDITILATSISVFSCILVNYILLINYNNKLIIYKTMSKLYF